MKCENCVWGKVALRSESELGLLTTIFCSRLDCPEMKVIKQEEEKMIKRPLIYVCSPLRGDMKMNLESAARYCRFVTDCKGLPIAPHLYFTQFLDDGKGDERELGLELGLNVLAQCSAVWVFGKKISKGMEAEIELAKQNKIPVLFFDTLCVPIDESWIDYPKNELDMKKDN